MTKVSQLVAPLAGRPAPTCPVWCVSDHTTDPDTYYYDHRGHLRSSGPYTVCVTSVEYINPADRRFDRTWVYLAGPLPERHSLLLEPRDALSLAGIFDAMGHGTVAQLLHTAAADLGEDGAQ